MTPLPRVALWLAGGLPRYLRQPLDRARAAAEVAARMQSREERFVEAMRVLVYARPRSPYLALLRRAGCTLGDLAQSVRARGVEATLARLRDEGVYVTAEEMKGATPIRRGSLAIAVEGASFANPALRGAAAGGTSSGSRAAPTSVDYSTGFLREEAAEESLLFAAHGVGDAPHALWYPCLPGIAGVHNLLLGLKLASPPQRWFSHVPPPRLRARPRDRLAHAWISACARLSGRRAPWPVLTPVEQARDVAAWLAAGPAPRALKTYTSSAVHAVRAAREHGLDVRGRVLFVGGEPLTDARFRYLRDAGATVVPRYVITEAGLVAASCGHGAHDEMHVWTDRLAVIQRRRWTAVGEVEVDSFLFTSLSLHTPRVLLNAELGDYGRLVERACACPLGALGLHQHVAGVRSHDKLTGEGMTLVGSDMVRILAALAAELGGAPDDVQLWEGEHRNGHACLRLAVSPRLGALDEPRITARFLALVEGAHAAGRLAADVWRQARTVELVRAEPLRTPGHKLLAIVRGPATRA